MLQSASREPVRAPNAGQTKHERRQFNAMMASLREMRRLRCAERKVPSAPAREAA